MLFKTDSELKIYLTFVNASFKLDHIKDRVKAVERDLIKDVLGKDEYTKLHTKYIADDMTAAQTALLPYVQETLAFLAFLAHIPYLNVGVAQGGLVVSTGEGQVAASQFRTEDLKSQVARDGYNALEALLEFLWNNSADYADWSASSAKAKYKKYFINTSKEFNEYVDINNSYYLYWRLRSNISYVEQSQIKGVLGNELFEEIKTQIVDFAISAENMALLEFIKPAVANLAFAQGVGMKSIQMDGDSVSEKYKSNFGNTEATNPARDGNVAQVITICNQNGQMFLQALKDYLYENLESYPLFEASDVYNDDEETANISIIEQNTEEDKVIIL